MSSIFKPNMPALQKVVHYPSTIVVPGVINTHTHPRDTDAENDGRAEMHIPLLAEACDVALCMGNTATPLTTSVLAMHKRKQWEALVPAGSRLKLKVGGLLKEDTDPKDVVAGYDQPPGKAAWDYMKMFVRSVSNAHGADVDDMSRIVPVLKAMTLSKFKHRKHPMTLSIHMERKYDLFGRRIFFLDRERASVERDLSYLFSEVPDATIVVCHVTTAYTIEVIRYLRARGLNVFGELPPHYMTYTCDDLIEAPGGGTMLNTHIFCLPVFKTEEDRRAVESAMLSGEEMWLFGCDDACWPDDPTKPVGVKINDKGLVLGGQTQIPAANVSLVIEKFVEAGKEHLLPGFLSLNACKAFGLPTPTTTRTFVRQDWEVPEYLARQTPRGEIRAKVAMGGQVRKYRPA